MEDLMSNIERESNYNTVDQDSMMKLSPEIKNKGKMKLNRDQYSAFDDAFGSKNTLRVDASIATGRDSQLKEKSLLNSIRGAG